MLKRMSILCIVMAMSMVLSVGQARADLVVDFGQPDSTETTYNWSRGSDEASETGDFDNDGNADDYREYYAFDETTPLSPDNGTYLNGTTSAVWYGGQEAISYDNDGSGDTSNPTGFYNARWVTQYSGHEYIYNRMNETTAISKINTVLLWKAEDFLLDDAYTFDGSSDSYITMADVGDGGSWFNYTEGRFIIKVAGQYYISEHDRTVDGLTLTNAGSAAWASYDPATDLGFDAASATFAPIDFSDKTLEAVGVFASRDDGSEHITAVDFFRVGAVPEPTTMALLGIGGLGAMLRRRR